MTGLGRVWVASDGESDKLNRDYQVIPQDMATKIKVHSGYHLLNWD